MGSKTQNENTVHPPDGFPIWRLLQEWHQTGYLHVGGQAKRAIGIAMGITERKLAEEALRRRTEELETILNTAPVPIFLAHDPECRRITGNPAAHALVQLPPEANISKAAPAEERPTRWQEMRDGVPIQPQDLPLQRATRGAQFASMRWTWCLRTGQ